MLVQKQKFRLEIFRSAMSAVHLRIYVAIDQEEILPAVVIEINKGIAPTDIALSSPWRFQKGWTCQKNSSARHCDIGPHTRCRNARKQRHKTRVR